MSNTPIESTTHSSAAEITAELSTEVVEKTADISLLLIERLEVAIPWLSHWYYKVALIIVFAIVLNLIKNRIFYAVTKWRSGCNASYDSNIMRATRRPFTTIIAIVAFEACRIILMEVFTWQWLKNANVVAVALGIYAVAIFIAELINNYERGLLTKPSKNNKEVNISTVKAVSKLSRLIIYIIATIVVLQMLGLSLTGLLAFGGVGGMVAGLAAKDLLANFFGAAMIYMDKPFRIGDWIRSPDREIEGTVEDIGWRVTRIRTFDKRPLYVPNAAFTTIAIENPSRMHNRRIKEFIGIRYDDMSKVEAIVEDIRRMLNIHNGVDHNNSLIVNLDSFSASTVDIMVQVFTNTVDINIFHPIKQDILLKVEKIITDHGAELAFPTTTMHVKNSL